MSNIGGGSPSTRWKVNLMECTQTIQSTSMMNGLNKIRERYKPTKMESTSVQGMVKTKLEKVEVEKASLFTHRCSLNFSLTVECPRLTQQKLLDSITSQTRVPL